MQILKHLKFTKTLETQKSVLKKLRENSVDITAQHQIFISSALWIQTSK